MLVLTRRVGETVVLDNHTRLTVVSIRGNKVRVGITAPDSVRVDREEVHRRVAGFDGDSEGEESRCGRADSRRTAPKTEARGQQAAVASCLTSHL
jgi:carbon storage regulator